MTHAILVYDDAIPVPDTIRSRIGISRFGDLLHQRRPLRDRMSTLFVDTRYDEPVVLTTGAERRAFVRRLRDRTVDARYVYLTADIVGADPDHLRRTLDTLGWSDRDVVVRPPDAPASSGIACLGGRRLADLLGVGGSIGDRGAWWLDPPDPIERLPDDPALGCLSDPDTFSRYLSGALDTRAFNALHAEGRVLRKHSADRDKIRREHDWYRLLPPSMQRFAVQPFDLVEDDAGASYRMERLRIPDAAIQWVHGTAGLPDEAARDLLDAVFGWIDARPVREDPTVGKARAQAFYRTKVDQRTGAFLEGDVGQQVDAILRATGHTEGLTGLVQRLHGHLDRALADAPPTTVTILHGDLCLSNILFDKHTGLLRLIDPRGADQEEELWGPPTYDLAKLSHSLIGGYDFINQGLYDVVFDTDLGARVILHGAERPEVVSDLLSRVQALGIAPNALRTFEASLFLSMLPLHAEDPRKCLAFALTGADILRRLDAGEPVS